MILLAATLDARSSRSGPAPVRTRSGAHGQSALPLPLAALAAVAVLAAAPSAAQSGAAGAPEPERLTDHTLRYDSTAARPAATLADAAWLVGLWEGEGLGGRVQEVWTPPAADRMSGAFTSLHEGGVRFQELLALVEVDGSLELWVRHFDPDFSAWEEKEDFVRFRLVRAEPGVLRFGGLTLERLGDDGWRAYLALRSGGALREELFEYRRVAAPYPG